MPHASKSYDSATLTEALCIIDAALVVMAAREATGEYYYEEILLKRSTLGDGGVAGNCDDCDDAADLGWIDSEDEFPTGDDEPPFHPHCTCSVEYKESRKRVYV